MKLDLKKFKKVGYHKDHTVMKHEDGHELTIAHAALSPKFREQLASMPMHKGSVDQGNPKLEESKKLPPKPEMMSDGGEAKKDDVGEPDPKKAKDMQDSAGKSGWDMAKENAKKLLEEAQKKFGLAHGGFADMAVDTGATDQDAMDAWIEKTSKEIGDPALIQGVIGAGMTAPVGKIGKAGLAFHERAALQKEADTLARQAAGKFNANEANALGEGVQKAEDVAAKVNSRLKGNRPVPPVAEAPIASEMPVVESPVAQPAPGELPPAGTMPVESFADGGEVDDEAAQISQGLPSSDSSQESIPVDMNPEPPQAMANPNAPQMMPNASPMAPNAMPAMAPDRAPAAMPQAQAPQAPGAAMPTLMGGLGKQIAGINQQASAEAKMGNQQAKDLEAGLQQQQEAINNYKQSFEEINNERKAFINDVQKGMVDPEKYWDDHSKLATGIGIILAGFNPTGRPNAAIEFLNHNIDRSVQAQAQNLSAKNNLLAANLHHFQNLNQAVQMTKIMQSDMLANHLKMEAAKAQDPMAKARALQLVGQLESQAAPAAMKLSMLQALQKQGHDANARQEDPASYVPFLVPEGQQKEVFHEIKTAQDAAKNKDYLMQQFDKAAKENTILRTGAGLLRTPASVISMNAMELPIIHDAEGRVNEFEQKTLSDLHPRPGDTADKIAEKRVGYEKFLDQKASAPTAKGHGIDLANFASTSANHESRFSPQQKSFADWARQNPNDPRSALILKKLGVK